MSSDTVKLDAPLFVTWVQCIVSVVICLLLRLVRKTNLPNPTDVFSIEVFKIVSMMRITIQIRSTNEYFLFQVMPVAILFTSMISTNNLCLKYVPVSFYYIGRSLTTVFNVILSYLLLSQTSSLRCIGCCAIIVSGFWLGVDQESVGGTQIIQFSFTCASVLSMFVSFSRIIFSHWNDIWYFGIDQFVSLFNLYKENVAIDRRQSTRSELLC